MAKNPQNPKKPVKTPKSKAHRPDVQPIGPALAELLNPAINRADAGMGSGTGREPPPRNSFRRRTRGESSPQMDAEEVRGRRWAAAHAIAAVSAAGTALRAPPQRAGF